MKAERAQELRMAIDRLPLTTRRAMLQGIEKNPIIVGADANLSGGLCPMLAASAASEQVGRPFARAWDRYARARLPRAATERELLTLRSMLDTSIEREEVTSDPLRAAIVSQAAPDDAQRRRVAQDARDAGDRHRAAQDAREAAREVRQALHDLRGASRVHGQETHQLAEPEVRHSAEYLQPAARVAAAKAEAKAKAHAKAHAKAQASRRRPADTGEYDRTWELASRDGWSWLRPFRRYDDYERALLDLERELEAVERRPTLDERELVSSSPGRG